MYGYKVGWKNSFTVNNHWTTSPEHLFKTSALSLRLGENNFGYLPIMPVNARDKQGQAGTSMDTKGQNRDKQGQAGTNRDIPFSVPACPYLSMSVHACPCLFLSVPVCPCLSLSVSVCTCMSLHLLYLHVYLYR